MVSFETILSDGVITLQPIGPEDTLDVVEAVQESVAEIMPWMSWWRLFLSQVVSFTDLRSGD